MNKLSVVIEEGKVVTLGNAKSIDAKVYDIPLDLDALTIEQAMLVYDYINENATEEYRNFISGTGDAPTRKAWSSQLKEYSALVCGAMAEITGIPHEAFMALTLRQQRVFCDVFELQVIRPLYLLGLYEPRNIREFEFEGTKYLLPKFSSDGFGGLLPMAEETTEAFAESNDLYMALENPYQALPLIVAILCRPEGEQYDELKARERAEVFKGLSCSVAFEVFFCKLTQMGIMGNFIHNALAEIVEKEEVKQEAQR